MIDLSTTTGRDLLDQIREACSTWGFFQLVGHGMDPSLLSDLRRAMEAFFGLEYAQKAKLRRKALNARGYFDDELTKQKRDWKEALDVGTPGSRDWSLEDSDPQNACLDGFNQFPSHDECPHFRETIVQYFDECSRLSRVLAKLMIQSLLEDGQNDQAAEDFLQRMEDHHTSYLRMNYYPPAHHHHHHTSQQNLHNNTFSRENVATEGTLGISPHRDAGLLTILLQDEETHSLQVARFEDSDLGETDNWVTVHPVPGALTINTGDMAMILSNGAFRAPLHRVLTDTAQRYSAPYFYNPGYQELIQPLPTLLVHQTKKYEPCLWGYFRALRFAGDLTDLGVELQTSHFQVGSDSSHPQKQTKFLQAVNLREPFNVDLYRRILVDS